MHYTKADEKTRACIEACLACYQTCFSMAMDHCLEAGGKHVEGGTHEHEVRGRPANLGACHHDAEVLRLMKMMQSMPKPTGDEADCRHNVADGRVFYSQPKLEFIQRSP